MNHAPASIVNVRVCCVFTMILLWAPQIFASETLQAELVSVATQPRAGAPIWVEVKLTSKSTKLREGALEFSHRVLGELQWTYTTQELALTGGQQTFRYLLPPAQWSESEDRSIRLRFIERNAASDLGVFSITAQLRPGWPLVIATGPTSARGSADQRATWLNFRLERFVPASLRQAAAVFSTGSAVLDSSDFPTDPMGYCAFDAIVLEGYDFARLKEKALTAMGQWLAAGGGLLVMADTVFDRAHAEALENWSASDDKAAKVQFDPDGKLIEPADGFSFARIGFGRLAITPERPKSEDQYDAEPWRRSAAWLWKLRAEQVDSIVRSGELKYDRGKFFRSVGRDPWSRFREAISKLMESLMPNRVRVIPRNLLLGLLAGFIFVIGPFDWWILGRLRARRFTWLFFPMATVAITAATMKLARHYIGGDNYRGSLVVTDLAPDGTVVRETRVEMLLPAEHGMLSEDLQRSFCVPVFWERDAPTPYNQGCGFIGNFPNRFRVTRSVRQWTPVLTRYTRIGGGEDRSRIKWETFRPEMLDKEPRREVAKTVAGDSGCTVSFSDRAGLGVAEPTVIDQKLLEALTYLPQTRGTGIFLHLSPSGAADLNDLACMESGDDRSTLVIAARRDGAELHLWRRLYLF